MREGGVRERERASGMRERASEQAARSVGMPLKRSEWAWLEGKAATRQKSRGGGDEVGAISRGGVELSGNTTARGETV